MAPWRDHPKLQGRFHPDAPDDLQVLVHDGGPRLTDRSPESVWVTVTGCHPGDVFAGRVLNNPQQLRTIAQGDQIKFIVPAGEHLLMVTDKYLAERPIWSIEPCDRCGLDELFDAPSDLMRAIFPNLPAGGAMEMFTSFCGVCRGVQIVRTAKNGLSDEQPVTRTTKRWWQFWRK